MGRLYDRYGARVVVLFGGLLQGLGLIVASRAQSLPVFLAVYGTAVGLAAGAVYVPLTAATASGSTLTLVSAIGAAEPVDMFQRTGKFRFSDSAGPYSYLMGKTVRVHAPSSIFSCQRVLARIEIFRSGLGCISQSRRELPLPTDSCC